MKKKDKSGIDPTVFYNYSTLEKLSKYLVSEFSEELAETLELNIQKDSVSETRIDHPVVKTGKTKSTSKELVKEPIAIVGVSGKYPGASNLDEFWQNLVTNKDSITEVPLDRWDWKSIYGDPNTEEGKTKAKWGGFIDDIDKFDASFFKVSPKEAELMDPQHRLCLESVWSALEDAGIATEQLSGSSTGVFIGVSGSDYLSILHKAGVGMQAQAATGVAHSLLVNRISYLLNIHGPSEPIDTACSSSLIAIHRAVENIHSGRCTMAIAGGVNAILSPMVTQSLSKAGVMSDHGRCKTFDEDANGYVRSEGVGMLILKPLSKAEADKDHIYAVIKGTSENHGGKANSLTAPNPEAQKHLLVDIYENSKISPDSVSYIEAHGTGTSLGDPVEVNALKMAFAELYEKEGKTSKKQYCKLGSVKTNIGHLESAAGIASITKVLLAMKHKVLPGNVHFNNENEFLKLENSPFYITSETQAWESDNLLRAGISSFGFGGSNAHVILEEYQANNAVKKQNGGTQLIVLSAKNKEQLKKRTALLVDRIEEIHKQNEQSNDAEFISLEDIAWTLQTGRSEMEVRLAFVADSYEILIDKLEKFLKKDAKQEGLFTGNTTEDEGLIGLLDGAEEQSFIDLILQSKNLTKIAKLWVSGAAIDWEVLYEKSQPKKISLPTYPFSKERYWVDLSTARQEGNIGVLDPLVHKNTSDIDAIRYTSVFTGKEKYFTSETSTEVSTLLETTYLEIVKKATILATNSIGIALENVVYETPFQVNKTPKEISIELYPVTENQFSFEIYSDEETLHAQGDVLISQKEEASHIDNIAEADGTLFSYLNWKSSEIIENKEQSQKTKMLLCGKTKTIFNELKKEINDNTTSIHKLEGDSNAVFHEALLLIKEAFIAKTTSQFILLIDASEEMQFGFLSGLFKTATIENSLITGKVISVAIDTSEFSDILKTIVAKEPLNNQEEIRYTVTGRESKNLSVFELEDADDTSLKEDGVYLVTGGLGGLGTVIAQEIASTAAQVIVTGRSELTTAKKEVLSSIANGVYKKCDVGQKEEVNALIEEIKTGYGNLNGVVHCAGIGTAAGIPNIDPEYADQVMYPKMIGVDNLDQALASESLDFMLFFSSISSVFGIQGLADYAAANTYMDVYASHRNALMQKGERFGKTISINWPFWNQGGMQTQSENIKALYYRFGTKSLPTSVGIDSFHKLLKTNKSQVLLSYGDVDAMQSKLFSNVETIEDKSLSVDKEYLKEGLTQTLVNDIHEILKIPKDSIEENIDFGDFGFDSITMTEFSNHLNQRYHLSLIPTLFYNYPNIATLSEYLISNYSTELVKAQQISKIENTPVFKASKTNRKSRKNRRRTFVKKSMTPEPIAIVGLSGQYPGSENVDAFWDNIINGKDLVTEVPKDRWDWKEIYGDAIKEHGKTKAKWGGFLKDVDKFDPLFFNISPLEAELMDPQQRLSLQAVWSALEDAGIAPSSIAGSNTGVFIGVSGSDYLSVLKKSGSEIDAQAPTGSAHAILVNRISYLLDIHGPSEPIDTACSSALVAIHKAVQNIHSGRCEMAIAGGVNIILSPTGVLSLSKAGMLSEAGRCKTFDKDANGYVRGEGVGMLILKSLAKAEEDGDRIYGVIKGTAENHGGKANTLTSPNPNAQTELLIDAYTKSKIDPASISYIEAHGTGTALGDPIEIEGLKTAFETLYNNAGKEIQKQHCALNSVKTNIGHLESASGIAGITKVLLAMKNRELPGNIHLQQENPYLQLKNSPFYLQKENMPWNAPYPLRAGISSFGYGGTNAHVILEEYVAHKKEKHFSGDVVIPISAKNKERLRDYIGTIVSHLDKQKELPSVYDIAWTLQVGRDAMQERIAIVCTDTKSLLQKCNIFLSGDTDDSMYTGNTKACTISKKELKVKIEEAQKTNNTTELAQLWAQGAIVSWSILYKEITPNKVQLPTYPFAKERYWVALKKALVNNAKLHPLVHQNKSNFDQQIYTSQFTGNESIIKDHIVNGEKVFPGVGYLEMAYAAGTLASSKKINNIQEISWNTPMVLATENSEVSTILASGKDGITYHISTNVESNAVVHSSGVLSTKTNVVQLPNIDIQSVIAQCDKNLTRQKCYEIFESLGLQYGASFQNIQSLNYSSEESISLLKVEGNTEAYELIPGLLDAAFQTTLGLSIDDDSLDGLALPFSIQEIQFYQALTTQVYCYARYSKDRKSTDRTMVYDIDITDTSGAVLMAIKDFMVLRTPPIEELKPETNELIYLQSKWQESEISNEPINNATEKEIVILINGTTAQQSALSEKYNGDVLLFEGTNPSTLFNTIFSVVQEALLKKASTSVTIIGESRNWKYFGFITGLLKTASTENPQFTGKVISVDSLTETTSDQFVSLTEKEKLQTAIEVQYVHSKRQIKQIEEISIPRNEELKSFAKEGGVYLITGGTGAIGKYMATHISKQKGTQVIILGRSPLENLESDWINNAENIAYHQCDISNRFSVEKTYKVLKVAHEQIHGIIHCAGVIKDNFIIKKTKEETDFVLAPKVLGTQNLDEVLKNEALDFVVYFSSLSSVTGNTGQADYAAANAYLEQYTVYRNELVAKGERYGKTMSIHWPYWENGGMHIEADSLQLMKNELGIAPLSNEKGLEALQFIIAQGLESVIVGYGNKQKLAPHIKKAANISNRIIEDSKETYAESVIKEGTQNTQKVLAFFKDWLSKELKLDSNRIHQQDRFEEYGIDSVIILKLTTSLEKIFGKIPKTLFFEYFNLEELSAYFIENHQATLNSVLHEEQESYAISSSFQNVVQKHKENSNDQQIFEEKMDRPASLEKNKDVAIIGLSGKYPGANTVDDFWDNLKNGVDSITEVPKDRWDMDKIFDPEKQKEGKIYCKWGGFIDGVDEFDSLFFNISPTEARSMEPQERLFLQSVWETIEDAGYTKSSLAKATGGKKNIGVYVGALYQEYQLYGAEETLKGNPLQLPGSSSSIANRVSFIFDFQGPSMALDTMCSSSLTSIHLACESILNGTCAMALAGGVNISIHPNKYLVLSQGGFISPTGKCRSFGAEGDGYVPSEGVGSVLLKPLADAERDGDHIYGIIKGSALGHGGKTNGYTVPNPEAQANVAKQAIQEAGVSSKNISYIEAHGTGTLLGDPIEIAGLSKVLKKDADTEVKHCKIGSVKSNIGHTEASAGIAGLTKVIMQMKHKQLAPSLYSEALNEKIDLDNTPFLIQQDLEHWDTLKNHANGTVTETPRTAGISGFGAGGANAHLIVEEYVNEESSFNSKHDGLVLIPLSARNEGRLKAYAEKLIAFLEKQKASNTGQLIQTISNELSKLIDIPSEELKASIYFKDIGVEPMVLSQLSLKLSSHFQIEIPERMLIASENIESLSIQLMNAYPELSEVEENSIDIHRIARTLQIGREPLKQRLAFVVSNVNELVYKLQNYVAGNLVGLFTGRVTDKNRNEIPNEISYRLSNGIDKKYQVLADLWVQGYRVDWDICYLKNAPQKISLPTYPFEKKKHWFVKSTNEVLLENTNVKLGLIDKIAAQSLEENGITYQVSLDENVPLLAAHKVNNVSVFPGVGYMQVVFEALHKIFPNKNIEIKDHFWLQTFQVKGKATLKLQLEQNKNTISYRFISEDKQTIYAQGKVSITDAVESPFHLDILALQNKLTPLVSNPKEKAIFYKQFDKQSIQYGDYYKRVDTLWSSENEVLGLLNLTENFKEDLVKYTLPPVLLDAALHCFAGLNSTQEEATFLPFRLSGFKQYRKLESKIYCHVKKITNENYKLTLHNEKGELLLECREFGFRKMKKNKPQDFTFLPNWKRNRLSAKNSIPKHKKILLVYSDAVFELTSTFAKIFEASENTIDLLNSKEISKSNSLPKGIDEIYLLNGIGNNTDVAYEVAQAKEIQEANEISIFNLVKLLMSNGYDTSPLKFTVLTENCQLTFGNDKINASGAGVIGLISAVVKECPDWESRFIDLTKAHITATHNYQKLVQRIYEEPYDKLLTPIAFRERLRYKREQVPALLPDTVKSKFKKDGVYVIFGGAGGLGEVTTEYLIKKYNAQVVWLGRRDLNSEIENKQKKLKKLGKAPVYIQADMIDKASVENAYQQIKSSFQNINGVIHSALVLQDRSIHNMNEETFRNSFDVKAIGTHIISSVFKNENLDFLCFYSSVQSYFPAAGQANYAAGCTYMDSLANELYTSHNVPVSIINWGYWGNAGAVTGEKYKLKMEKTGIGSIEADEGMQLLENVLALKVKQISALKMKDQVKEQLEINTQKTITVQPVLA